MNETAIAQVLLQTTGSLKPASFTTVADLEETRTILAQTLLHGIAPEQLISKPATGAAKPAVVHAATFDDTVQSQIQKLATSVLAGHDPAATPTQLAYLSSLAAPSTSAPAWASGMAVTKTLGPFEDNSGIPYWLHIFNLTFSLQFAFGSAANVFGVFPVRIDIGDTPVHLDLGAGSIWFPAPWFAAGSPSGSFTGFQIQGGALDFSVPVSLISGVVVVPSGATFTLSAQLAPHPSPTPANGPGADANHAKVQTPVNIQIDFAENSAKLVALGDSSLNAYGTTVNLPLESSGAGFRIGTGCYPLRHRCCKLRIQQCAVDGLHSLRLGCDCRWRMGASGARDDHRQSWRGGWRGLPLPRVGFRYLCLLADAASTLRVRWRSSGSIAWNIVHPRFILKH